MGRLFSQEPKKAAPYERRLALRLFLDTIVALKTAFPQPDVGRTPLVIADVKNKGMTLLFQRPQCLFEISVHTLPTGHDGTDPVEVVDALGMVSGVAALGIGGQYPVALPSFFSEIISHLGCWIELGPKC